LAVEVGQVHLGDRGRGSSPGGVDHDVDAANVGLSLSRVTQPGVYRDPGLAYLVRKAVLTTALVPPDSVIDEQSSPDRAAAATAER